MSASQGTIVTGFLAFGGVKENPSALLAKSLGRRFELLEVSFAAVDQFLVRCVAAAEQFDRLVMLGLRTRGSAIELERVAKNTIGATPDVRGVVRGPGTIDSSGPDELRSTMFHDDNVASAAGFSDDAGCYLCNYIYYRALRLFPDKRVGFVHVPPLDVLPLETQREELLRLIVAVEARRDRDSTASAGAYTRPSHE